MRRVVVLGSTGSIGVNTLKVVQDHPQQFQVVGLAARNHVKLLAEQIRIFRPRWVALEDESRLGEFKRLIHGSPVEIFSGSAGVAQLAGKADIDLVVVAITGAAALAPTLEAIAQGRVIGLANKETLVMAGELVMKEAARRGATLLPIDSEHSAIFQCLESRNRDRSPSVPISQEVRRILLTTSGGPLKDIPLEQFGSLTRSQVMAHPRWKMGPKITVDSATMMNKALEVIEARSLFELPVEKIEILVHPEAIIHSMVEYIDGSILAQLAVTDMRIPIQYAMSYPHRLTCSLEPLDLVGLKHLTFEAPQREKFPCLEFGYEAARQGGTLPSVLNAANEACVKAYLEDGLAFNRIPATIENVLKRHQVVKQPTLAQILEADLWARQEVKNQLNVYAGVP